MIIESIDLKDFRNYRELRLIPSPGISIFYGDNAQGKTNLLEAVYVGCTARSHKSSRDRELINFDSDEAHIKLGVRKKDVPYRIDMHIKKNRSKGIALNGMPLRRASELFGIANVIFFSPEDLSIIKNGPGERRRFADMELCQLDRLYTHDLISYNRIVNQKNTLLKSFELGDSFYEMLDIYNEQLVTYGTRIITKRQRFIEDINNIIADIHSDITSGRERLSIRYEENVLAEAFSDMLSKSRDREIKQRMSLIGPHRDDLCFTVNDLDIRHYGSQGQQRTAALSLKLSEIKLVEGIIHEKPVLLLDDVLSELDRGRQTMLLNSIKDVQTMITCTGLDDFIDNRFHIDKIFNVTDGRITGEN